LNEALVSLDEPNVVASVCPADIGTPPPVCHNGTGLFDFRDLCFRVVGHNRLDLLLIECQLVVRLDDFTPPGLLCPSLVLQINDTQVEFVVEHHGILSAKGPTPGQ
jgi:hypothetical protein